MTMFKKIIEKYKNWKEEKEKEEVERREFFEAMEKHCNERDTH